LAQSPCRQRGAKKPTSDVKAFAVSASVSITNRRLQDAFSANNIIRATAILIT